MKKLLTILLAFGFTAAIAQPGKTGSYDKQPQRDYHNDDRSNDNRRYDNVYVFTAREKDGEIARINRDFDYRIRAIEADRFLRNRQKRKEIESIQSERSRMIGGVIAKFTDRRNRANNPYAYDHKRF